MHWLFKNQFQRARTYTQPSPQRSQWPITKCDILTRETQATTRTTPSRTTLPQHKRPRRQRVKTNSINDWQILSMLRHVYGELNRRCHIKTKNQQQPMRISNNSFTDVSSVSDGLIRPTYG